MFGTVVITCLIFQTSIAVYLLHISMSDDNFEKDLQKLMVIILIHLCARYFLDIYLKGSVLYGNVATGFGLLYGPFLYIILKSHFRQPLEQRKKRIHLSAFFIFSILYILFAAGNILKLISSGFISRYAYYYELAVVFSQVFYTLAIQMLLKNFLKTNSSDLGKTNLIKNISLVVLANVFLTLAFHILHYIKPGFAGDREMKLLKNICFAFIPFLILKYKIKKKEFLLTDFSTADNGPNPENIVIVHAVSNEESKSATEDPDSNLHRPVKKYQKSGLDNKMMDDYELALKEYIQNTRIYLDAELTLDQLSNKVNIPKHHITQLLNDKMQKNFYTFINEYRIREAIKILSNASTEINILSLAYDCGFNSKSSFNNYFKKITGQTPSSYRKTFELLA